MAQLLDWGIMLRWGLLPYSTPDLMERLLSLSFVEFLTFAWSQVPFSFAVAVLVVIAVAITQRIRRTARVRATAYRVPARYVRESWALGFAAIAVVVVYGVEYYVRNYRMSLADVVEWWQYATPVFAASVSLLVVLGIIVARGSNRPEQPVFQHARRNWMTFSTRSSSVGAIIAFSALLLTTITAGLASSSDDRGRFIHVVLPIPNASVGAMKPWFYGWSFGVPVLVCMAFLALVVLAALHSNAVRPFLNPDAVAAERVARTAVASAVLQIATAGLLLALGGAFRFIGRAGYSGNAYFGDEDGGSTAYEVVWRYSDLADVLGWFAPVAEITAFCLLLFVARRMLRARAADSVAVVATEPSRTPEVVR